MALSRKISIISKLARIAGLDPIFSGPMSALTIYAKFPKDMDAGFRDIYYKCLGYTMTSIERMYCLYKSVEYIVNSKIPGDFVECGVWKGGSSMVMALALQKFGDTGRKIYLYDTYTGMSEPTVRDKEILDGTPVMPSWKKCQKKDYNLLCHASLNEVKDNLFSTHYPGKNIIFVKGKVEDTIPKTIPKHIALLRLDTDWYESTFHELIHLYPLLSERGVLVLDDYGHFSGAKEAVDQYFSENKIHLLLSRIDYTGRLGIK